MVLGAVVWTLIVSRATHVQIQPNKFKWLKEEKITVGRIPSLNQKMVLNTQGMLDNKNPFTFVTFRFDALTGITK